MFIDTARLTLKAGDGGDGAVSFRREKYVANGGPDGGDGGRGGSVIFVGDSRMSTLSDFKYRRRYEAEKGGNGGGKCMNGKKGQDIVIRIPAGTLIYDADTGRLMADAEDGRTFVAAKGGSGGAGNRHFATPTRQCPRFAKNGAPGEELTVDLELKLLADVGLVGFPNAGKSTILSAMSNAEPVVAAYPFTTLNPILGVVGYSSESSFVMADMPGIIKGAADGAGLGHSFLRHIERCRMLVQVVDAAAFEGRDPKDDFDAVCSELERYSRELAGLPRLVAVNKCDAADPDTAEELCKYVRSKGFEAIKISGATGEGLDVLKKRLFEILPQLPEIRRFEPEPEPAPAAADNRSFRITVREGVYIIEAPWLAKILSSVNTDDYESLQYFQRVLRSSGIIDELVRLGVRDGDTVSIYDFDFEYVG